MKSIFFAVSLSISSIAAAKSIPMYSFPLKNSASGETTYDMKSHPNGVFIFEAYQNYCSDCHRNAPNVNELAAEYLDNERVQFLDLSLDTRSDQFASWIARHKPNHPVIQDVQKRVHTALGDGGWIPQVYVVNCKGDMIYTYKDYWTADVKQQLREAIQAGLDTSCDEAR